MERCILDISYCYEKCLLGRAKAEDFIYKNNSVFDAATDFRFFVESCLESCPFKENITAVNNKEYF
jgi:hypothetical protein